MKTLPKKKAKDTSPIEKVSTIQAAERQLKTAINLFFNRGDSVSIHTLTAAAHKILHDIGKKKGIKSIRDDSWVRKDKRNEFHEIINGAERFFKHGTREKEKAFDFRPLTTPLYIIDALHLHSKIGETQTFEGLLFSFWFGLKNPDTLDLSFLSTDILTRDAYKTISATDPNDLDLFAEILRQHKISRGTR